MLHAMIWKTGLDSLITERETGIFWYFFRYYQVFQRDIWFSNLFVMLTFLNNGSNDYMWCKRSCCSDESSPDSAVPLSFLEHFSIFRLIVLVSSTRLYCFFSHSHCSHRPCFQSFSAKKALKTLRTADRHSERPAGEHGGAFQQLKSQIFPSGVSEDLLWLNGEWILDSLGGQKHASK